jgi:hypothetical protein
VRTILSIIFLFSINAFAQKNTNTGTSGGRFQLIQLSDFRRDQYLLDTQTGKMWTKVCYHGDASECSVSAWTPQDIIGINATENEVRKTIEAIKKYEAEEKSEK